MVKGDLGEVWKKGYNKNTLYKNPYLYVYDLQIYIYQEY